MELCLPGLSGLHLQRLVLDRTEMPVIFMSGAADIPTTVTAMRAGALEFLTKPLRSDGLCTRPRSFSTHDRFPARRR